MNEWEKPFKVTGSEMENMTWNYTRRHRYFGTYSKMGRLLRLKITPPDILTYRRVLRFFGIEWGIKFEVWTEGYRATGMEYNTEAMFHGFVKAKDFTEACKIVLGDSLDKPQRPPGPSVWACRCYDNEIDARKSFG